MASKTSISGDDKYLSDAKVALAPVLEESEVGYSLYQEAKQDGITWVPSEERAILRKIDLYILPCFGLTQGLSYLDKIALNYGNLFGMKTDLHVTGSQFSWFASAFYLGYLVSAEPTTWLLQRYSTGRVMGAVCFLWGIVVMSTAACRSFSGTIVNRVILGILEACVTPGLGLMTPFWWRLEEQPVRHLSWYCSIGIASLIGDILAYGLGHVTHSQVPAWALIFLVLGGFTALWGAYLFFMLPDSPASARFLDHRQKIIAVKRVAENRTGTKNKVFKRYQVVQALSDPKTYMLFFGMIAAQVPNGVVTNFSSIIISDMGFNKFQTMLLDIPLSVVQVLALLVSGYLASRFRNSRAIMMFIGNAASIVAAAALTYAPQEQKWGRLVAFWFTSCQSVGFALSMVMVSANVGGFTKRQITTVFIFVGYCIGNIAGPHTLLDSEAGIGYPTATKAMMAGYVVKAACHLALGLYMWYENRRRDKAEEKAGTLVPENERARLAEEAGMSDVTEFDNRWFRYVL